MAQAKYSYFEYHYHVFSDVGEDLLAMCEQNVALNKHLMEPGSKCYTVIVGAIASI